MKVLTLRRPWAGAIFQLGKDVENRVWRTDYRGPLLILNGSTKVPAYEIDEAMNWVGWGGLNAGAVTADELSADPGHIIGVVDLVDIIKSSSSRWAQPRSWHWLIENPRRFPIPVPCKGALRLIDPPDGFDLGLALRTVPHR